MNRNINFEPYEINSLLNNNHEIISVIFTYRDDFYYIEDEYGKLEDVSQMPDYIKIDWIKYNKKPINMITLNKHIKYLKEELENTNKYLSKSYINKKEKEINHLIDELKSIRRDLIIKGIIE